MNKFTFYNTAPEYETELNQKFQRIADKLNAALYLSSTLQAIDLDTFCRAVDLLEKSAIEDVRSLGIAAKG